MRRLRSYVGLAGLALTFVACGSEDTGAQKKTVSRVYIPENAFTPKALEATIDDLIEEIGQTEPVNLQLGVVLKNVTGYWEPVKLGANRAFGELGVSGVVLAPSEANEEDSRARQIQILHDRRDSGYQGFGVAPLAQVLAPEIDALVDSGVPVVTIDSDLTDSKRALYVGTINSEAGRTSAETLLGYLGGAPGTVIVLGHEVAEEWPDGYNRTMGAKQVLEAAGYTVVVRQTTWSEEGEIADIDFMKQELMAADPPAVGMLSMFSPTFRCAQALQDSGLPVDSVSIVGFDFEPETVQFMREGLIQATHAQRQYYMGYMVPYVLYSANVLGMEATKDIIGRHMVDDFRFDAGLDVVPAGELDEYNAFLDSLGISG